MFEKEQKIVTLKNYNNKNLSIFYITNNVSCDSLLQLTVDTG